MHSFLVSPFNFAFLSDEFDWSPPVLLQCSGSTLDIDEEHG